jgi:thiamine kinase-like enzyme
MLDRQKHQQEVRRFLQDHFGAQDWSFSLPHGTGMETYFVQGNGREYFVKVGVKLERYQVMAELGLAPPILVSGPLESGPSIIVQARIDGRIPPRKDYRERLETVAAMIHTMHGHPSIRGVLPKPSSTLHKDAGLNALNFVRRQWELYRPHGSKVTGFVDNSLDRLESQIRQFPAEGLFASHRDICNANWLFVLDGKIYLIDFESLAMDDPAFDLGALLWWYYPPELRGQFLEIAGYPYDDEFKIRMQVRMALHCLSITLPRNGSFDSFDPKRYREALVDFRAILAGKENPKGYSI